MTEEQAGEVLARAIEGGAVDEWIDEFWDVPSRSPREEVLWRKMQARLREIVGRGHDRGLRDLDGFLQETVWTALARRSSEREGE